MTKKPSEYKRFQNVYNYSRSYNIMLILQSNHQYIVFTRNVMLYKILINLETVKGIIIFNFGFCTSKFFTRVIKTEGMDKRQVKFVIYFFFFAETF